MRSAYRPGIRKFPLLPSARPTSGRNVVQATSPLDRTGPIVLEISADVREVSRDGPFGLGGEELPPGRPHTPCRGVDTGLGQVLPHREVSRLRCG